MDLRAPQRGVLGKSVDLRCCRNIKKKKKKTTTHHANIIPQTRSKTQNSKNRHGIWQPAHKTDTIHHHQKKTKPVGEGENEDLKGRRSNKKNTQENQPRHRN